MGKTLSKKQKDKETLSRTILNILDGKDKKSELKRLKKELKKLNIKEKEIEEETKKIAKQITTNNKKYKTNSTIADSELNLENKFINPKDLLKGEKTIETLSRVDKSKTKKGIKNTEILNKMEEIMPIRIWENNKKSFKHLKLTDDPKNPLTWPLAEDGTPKKSIYFLAPQENHTIIIGDTGSGKTAFILHPTLHTLATSTDEPSIVLTDPKGELFEQTSKWYKENGYDVKVLNLVSNKAVQGLYWNPMTEIKILHNKATTLEKLISVILASPNKQLGVQELFKNEVTKKILEKTYYSVLKEETYKNKETAIIKYIVNPVLSDGLPDASNTKVISDLQPYPDDENARVDDYVYLVGEDKPISTAHFEDHLLNALELSRDRITIKRDNLVSDMVKTFVESDSKGDGGSNSKFFEEQSRKYIQFWIELLMYDKKCTVEYFSLHNVTSLAATYKQASDEEDTEDLKKIKEYIDGEMKSYREEFGVEHPLQTESTEWTNKIGSVGTFSSSLSSALGSVTPFTAAGHWIASSTTTINFEDIIKKKTILYIMKPDSDKSKDAYVIMFFVRLYKALTELSYMYPGGKLPRLCYFIIEEFASMPKFKDFDTHITIARGRGIRFILILQSYDQLDDKYGSGAANVIKSNCKNKIWVNTNDQKSRQEFREVLGNAKFIKFDKEKISREEVEKLADNSSVFEREDEPMLKHLTEESRPLLGEITDLGLKEDPYNKEVITDMSGQNPVRMYLFPFWDNKWKIKAMADMPSNYESLSFKNWVLKHRYNPMAIPEEVFVGNGEVGSDVSDMSKEKADMLARGSRRFEENELRKRRESYMSDLEDDDFDEDDDSDNYFSSNSNEKEEQYLKTNTPKELKEIQSNEMSLYEDEDEIEDIDSVDADNLDYGDEYDELDDEDVEMEDNDEDKDYDSGGLQMYDDNHRNEKYDQKRKLTEEEEEEILKDKNVLIEDDDDDEDDDLSPNMLFGQNEKKSNTETNSISNTEKNTTHIIHNTPDDSKIKDILNPVFEKQDRMARDMEDLKHLIRNQTQQPVQQIKPQGESTMDKLMSLMIMKEMSRMNGGDIKKENDVNQIPVNYNPYTGAPYPVPTNITMIPNIPMLFHPTTGVPIGNNQPQQNTQVQPQPTSVNVFNNQADPSKYHPYLDPNRKMRFNPYNGGFLMSQPFEFKMRDDAPFLYDPYNGKPILNLDNGKNHLKNQVPNFKIDEEKEIMFNPYDGRSIEHQQTPFRIIDKEPFLYDPYTGEQIVGGTNNGLGYYQQPQKEQESLDPLKQKLKEQEIQIQDLLNRKATNTNTQITNERNKHGFLKAKLKDVSHLSNPYKDELVNNFRKNIDDNLKPDIDPLEMIKRKIREN